MKRRVGMLECAVILLATLAIALPNETTSSEADVALHLVKAVVYLGLAISGVVEMVEFRKQWQAAKIEDANAKKEKLEQEKTEGENMDEHCQ